MLAKVWGCIYNECILKGTDGKKLRKVSKRAAPLVEERQTGYSESPPSRQ